MREYFEDNDHTTLLHLPCTYSILLVETTDKNETHKTKQPTPHLLPTEVEQEKDKTMDVTFVLEESGVTATVEVPCEADVAAAKEVACTVLAVSPASVEMRIGTQVLEGTCRLQDTAFDAGVQVVLARPRFADIKCPGGYNAKEGAQEVSLSRCGTLCMYRDNRLICGFDTETFNTAFEFTLASSVYRGAISQCKTRCYLVCREGIHVFALPGGEVLRKVNAVSESVSACSGVVVSQGTDGVSVYDEDLTLLRSLTHEGCTGIAVSDCGGWVITSSDTEKNARLWDVNTGESVACVPVYSKTDTARRCSVVALSRSASVFAVASSGGVQLYDWSGAALRVVVVGAHVVGMQFTPCGKYFVVHLLLNLCVTDHSLKFELRQYDVANMSCVLRIENVENPLFAISPCSRVVVCQEGSSIVTRHLSPHNSE